ncbi:hypothetical protein F0310_04640 (plasmid) [Borrelia sp. A-FGy1]|uniref:hypothetical protein n=1 Tax=Borrelia sp. A-FGy1 TaxID=2608247 RepID=UPI0015F43E7D|nr:hypothetical protein [Borrelia sp. A-FGy1]QMU99705.1 hypothetical protein F0310_04640 [Borrelia sp. A-FGy1]
MFILIISTVSKLLFLSSKFFRNKSTSKRDLPLPVTANTTMLADVLATNTSSKITDLEIDTFAQVDRHTRHTNITADMLAADVPATNTSSNFSVSLEKQGTASKLTEDDKDKLKSFFSKTTTYQSSLDSIYNKYASSYNAIDTYTDCSIYSIGCFNQGHSARRNYALKAVNCYFYNRKL